MTGPLVLVSAIPGARGAAATAAGLAVASSAPQRPALWVDLGTARPRRPAMLASAASRRLEDRLAERLEGIRPAARGALCHLWLEAAEERLERLGEAIALADGLPCVVGVDPGEWQACLDDPALDPNAALIRADLPADRAAAALAVADLRGRRIRAVIAKRPLPATAAWRAVCGWPGTRLAPGIERLARAIRRGELGQALPLVLGAAAVLLVAALALVAIAGAITGKGRVQRAADLAALSGARSMRDDLASLLAPTRLAGGLPNPAHIGKREYLANARDAATEAARANGVAPGRVRVSFPDRDSFAPLRSRVTITATIAVGEGEPIEAAAEAEAALPVGAGEMPGWASGGGYSGPLIYRQGEGMRPDVAAAFDRMAAAAAADGVLVTVTSGFRSDAEQAALFAANPDPRMVAPPGQSLHRCATELDLGPPTAWGWLAGNAGRFGFVQRYSWEAWHYGYDAGPPPCSAAAQGWAGGDGESASVGIPSFVPAEFRGLLADAAARWNVSAALLGAQLMAESGFDPGAVSPAGALGIAQFIPSTAAAYGLADPFDPAQAIDAQAHLMSDLLGQFGDPTLALAAYNAGPGAVAGCGCANPYAETEAYVARIMALLDGAAALLVPPFEVRLIE